MRIIKVLETETAHIVRDAVSDRCKYNIHGHSYKWEVCIGSNKLLPNGMVLDFKELKPIKDFIDLFDHTTVFWSLEDEKIIDIFKENFRRVLVMKKNTTAENMARLIFRFSTKWLLSYYPLISNAPNNELCPLYVENIGVWETRTGCGIATEYDDDDILTYTHKDK